MMTTHLNLCGWTLESNKTCVGKYMLIDELIKQNLVFIIQ
jgi:hypothetical protein